MKFNHNIHNTINLLKGEFGKHKVNIMSNTWYKFNFKNEEYFYMHNNNSKILEIFTIDGVTITTKAQNIYLPEYPMTVKKLVLNTTSVPNEVEIKKEDMPVNVSELPKILVDELTNYVNFNKNSDYNHLFQYPLRDDLADALEIENKGTNVYISQHGQPIRTLLHTQYDHENKILYSDSWSYIIKCIESIERKVETLPMMQRKKLKQETNDLLYKLSCNINNMGESINLELLNIDLKEFVDLLGNYRK